MKYILPFIVFTFSFFIANAQQHSRTIEWMEYSNAPNSNIPNIFPDFIGSVKNNIDSAPIYTETINIAYSVSDVSISNPVYSVVNQIGPTNFPELAEEIKIDYHVFCSGKDKYLQLQFIPFIKKENKIFRLEDFEINITEKSNLLKAAESKNDWSSSSVLASGKWVQIKTESNGIHKIKHSDLQSWGFSNPEAVNLYGNGGFMLSKQNIDPFFDNLQQNPVWHGKDSNNVDCMFFYSTGTIKWEYNNYREMFLHQQNNFSQRTYYYLSDVGSTKIIQENTAPAEDATKQFNTYDRHELYEKNEENLINSGSLWYSDRHVPNSTTPSYPFDLPARITSKPVKIFMQAVARSSSSNQLDIFLNANKAGQIIFETTNTSSVESAYAKIGTFRLDTIFNSDHTTVKSKYIANDNKASAWIDFVVVNTECNLAFNGTPFQFRNYESFLNNDVARYSISGASQNTQVWDITDFLHPEKMQTEISGSTLSFKSGSEQLKEFIVFDPAQNIPAAEKVQDIENQDLHALNNPEYIIITHPDFLDNANELAVFHQTFDMMSVSVVTTNQIFNEFSSGIADVAGIRNFIRMCYEKGNEETLKYVLLLGDGSFDNQNVLGEGFNFVPTYQSDESLSYTKSFVSDDFFVLLNENEGDYSGLVDLGIGRIPARNTEEADAVVQKIKNYVTPEALGKWRNVACFIGDDGNNQDAFTNQHMSQCETLTNSINQNYPSFYTDKIYFDAFRKEISAEGGSYPDINTMIDNRVNEGVLILNYIGHANEEFLADENVLDKSTIDSWTNINNLPVFVTATCEFSRFDSDELSAGEHILFNANGGGIGLFSTTRLVYSGANFNLSRSFYSHVFEKDKNGENLRMGDIMRLAKIGSNTGINKRNFTLLADPALRLSYPKLKVTTSTINGQAVENFAGTVSALNKVTITGKITDHSGNTVSSFNGTITPTVYDKMTTLETIGNEGQDPMAFSAQNNIIYKGNVSVSNGEFSFSFIVPKDISYSIDSGKILYYAENGKTDANGAFTDFLIGGSSGSVISDNDGPEINLYINDELFKSGDKVGASPLMIADVSDENGINTVGTGIGHDITAVLDEDFSHIYVLNDYYQADKDSYQSGKVVFPFNDLEPGKHKLTLKIWDVVNNSSEATIEFIVTSDFKIEKVWSYPHPVTDFVNFKFEHNLPNELLTTTIEIFDRSGKKMDTIRKSISSNGNESSAVRWQPSETNIMMQTGLYFFRINVTSEKGYSTAKTGKFIFSK